MPQCGYIWLIGATSGWKDCVNIGVIGKFRMTRLQGRDDIEIQNSQTIVSFDKKGGGNWEVWHRLISIEGKPAYEIGNICGTCSFYFERLEGANQSVQPKETIEQLNEGLKSLEKEVVKSVSTIIPNGKYKILLLTIYPKLVELGKENDYFTKEQIELWGLDGFYGIPYNPKVPYYRGTDQNIKENEKVFEFIIPMFPQTWLDKTRLEYYDNEISKGTIPTAICLTVLDIKAPAVWNNEEQPEFVGHWCLAHYILDGHHKLYAAAKADKPINLLSFLAIDECILETDSDIRTLLDTI